MSGGRKTLTLIFGLGKFYFLVKSNSDIQINSDLEKSIPSIINVSFADVNGETLMSALDNVALSSGLACNSELVEPSYVLKGIGLSNELAALLRFSFGRYTIEEKFKL